MNTAFNCKSGRKLAKYSFVVGTGLFVYHLVLEQFGFNPERATDLLFVGYFFLIFAVVLNLAVLFILIVNLLVEKENRKPILITIGLMLLNIPIAFLYALITLGVSTGI